MIKANGSHKLINMLSQMALSVPVVSLIQNVSVKVAKFGH